MEAGRIGQDGCIGRLGRAGPDQLAHLGEDSRDVRDHFDDAYHRDRPLIHYRSYPGGLHPRAGASKELGGRMPCFQDFHQPGSVQIPGGFACGYEEAHLSPV